MTYDRTVVDSERIGKVDGTAPAEPSQESPRRREAHQSWCSTAVPLGADQCPRCGVWQPANNGATKLGAYSRQAIERPDAVAAMAEKREALRAHVGEPSVVQEDLIGDYARLDVITETVAANIGQMGVLTGKGRTRAAVTLLLQLLDRRVRYAQLLGLARQSRPVESATDIIAQYAQRNEAPQASTTGSPTKGELAPDADRPGEPNVANSCPGKRRMTRASRKRVSKAKQRKKRARRLANRKDKERT